MTTPATVRGGKGLCLVTKYQGLRKETPVISLNLSSFKVWHVSEAKLVPPPVRTS